MGILRSIGLTMIVLCVMALDADAYYIGISTSSPGTDSGDDGGTGWDLHWYTDSNFLYSGYAYAGVDGSYGDLSRTITPSSMSRQSYTYGDHPPGWNNGPGVYWQIGAEQTLWVRTHVQSPGDGYVAAAATMSYGATGPKGFPQPSHVSQAYVLHYEDGSYYEATSDPNHVNEQGTSDTHYLELNFTPSYYTGYYAGGEHISVELHYTVGAGASVYDANTIYTWCEAKSRVGWPSAELAYP